MYTIIHFVAVDKLLKMLKLKIDFSLHHNSQTISYHKISMARFFILEAGHFYFISFLLLGEWIFPTGYCHIQRGLKPGPH